MNRLAKALVVSLAGASLACGSEQGNPANTADTSVPTGSPEALLRPSFLDLIDADQAVAKRVDSNLSGFPPIQHAQMKDIILFAHSIFSKTGNLTDKSDAERLMRIPIIGVSPGQPGFNSDMSASWRAKDGAMYVPVSDASGEPIGLRDPILTAITVMHEVEHAREDFVVVGSSVADQGRIHCVREARTNGNDIERVDRFLKYLDGEESLLVRPDVIAGWTQTLNTEKKIRAAKQAHYQVAEKLFEIADEVYAVQNQSGGRFGYGGGHSIADDIFTFARSTPDQWQERMPTIQTALTGVETLSNSDPRFGTSGAKILRSIEEVRVRMEHLTTAMSQFSTQSL